MDNKIKPILISIAISLVVLSGVYFYVMMPENLASTPTPAKKTDSSEVHPLDNVDFSRNETFAKLLPEYIDQYFSMDEKCQEVNKDEIKVCEQELGRFSCVTKTCIRPLDLKVIYNIQEKCKSDKRCQERELDFFKSFNNEYLIHTKQCKGNTNDITSCHLSYSSWDCQKGYCAPGQINYEMYQKVFSQCNNEACVSKITDLFKNIFCNSMIQNELCIPKIQFILKLISCEQKYFPTVWVPQYGTCAEKEAFEKYFVQFSVCTIDKKNEDAKKCMEEFDEKMYQLVKSTTQIKPSIQELVK